MFGKGQKKGTVKFSIKASNGAKSAELAGDFTDWEPIEMKKQKTGNFAVTVPLTSGTYQYKFIVDGQWVADPDNDLWAPNPYGSLNSVAQVQ